MGGPNDHPRLEFRSRAAIRAWLEANHAKETTFWLMTFKKHVGEYYVPYGEVVEELLCYGWVDSRTRRVDDDRTMLLVSPRKPGSTWSASNKRRVADLEKRGLMTPAGHAKIESAREDGSWHFLDDIENLIEPDDLARALDKNQRCTPELRLIQSVSQEGHPAVDQDRKTGRDTSQTDQRNRAPGHKERQSRSPGGKRPIDATRSPALVYFFSDGERISMEPLKVAPSSIATFGETMLPLTLPESRTVTPTVA